MTAEFKRQIDHIRSGMVEMLAAKRSFTPPQLPSPYGMPYPDFALHAAVLRQLDRLAAAVTDDIDRYRDGVTIKGIPSLKEGEDNTKPRPIPTGVPSILGDPSKLSAEELIILNLGTDEEIAELAALKQKEAELLAAQQKAQKSSAKQEEAPASSGALDPLRSGLPLLDEDDDIESPLGRVPKNIDLDPATLNTIKPTTLRLYCLIFREIQEASVNLAAWGIPMPSLQRIKKAMQNVAQDRIGDAIVILRNGRKDDPNNKLMAFTLSQLLYHRCQEGHAENLPEAREEAKKSCSFDERYPQEKLTFFRYQHVASEMAFSKERAQELLREYYLIGADTLMGEEGLKLHRWHHLKALVLLSRLPVEFWSPYEVECVHALAEQVIGGALIYLRFFRPLVLQKLATEDAEYQRFHATEHALRLVYLRHRAATDDLRTHFTPDGTPNDPPARLWTVASRFLTTFMQNSPLPAFENLLANTSLDGRHNKPAKAVDARLHAAGLHDVAFWPTWIMKTSHDPALYNDGALPDKAVRREVKLLKEFDTLLATLKAWEAPFVGDEKWEKAKLYLAPLPHEKLLELGTGQPLGGLAFGSGDAVYKNYYKGWSSVIEDEILASDDILRRAEAGVFWGVDEIIATFDGAQRVMEDPLVGLQSRVRAGYRKYVQNREKGGGTLLTAKPWQGLGDESFSQHFRQFWWLYTILVPLAVMTFIVIVSARSYENAFRMILVMMAFGIFGFFVFSYLLKQKQDDDPPQTPPLTDAADDTSPPPPANSP
jgi:hypothetical protein